MGSLSAVMTLSVFTQGAFLASALQRQEAAGWITWGVVLAFAIAAIVIAAVKAKTLARQNREN